MLVPAILYANEIKELSKKFYYTDDMAYWIGDDRGSDCFYVNEGPTSTGCCSEKIQLASISNDESKELIGLICYDVDYYSSCVYNFGIFSFKRNTITFGKDLDDTMTELLNYHRIEWRCMGGNPVSRHYDKFCEQHNGTKYILHDVFKDKKGNYHDSYTYEIINPNK